ncbi:MAG: hypothetical protein IPG55_06760 [Saprospiraceae bacterium]|nr:hypothetical protein [Candidatus Defluviibacterium haderslevense]MBK7245679.1 hypothetical protein [Candidatus Defluviibacterium haderslevense]
MDINGNSLIAFDGHDGSGKTTLSKMFAEKTDTIYVRPFSGDMGTRLLELAEKKDFDSVSKFGADIINNIYARYKNEILVFDRHWMTVFSLLPEKYWYNEVWLPLPKTILCYVDLRTTLSRLKNRMEEEFDRDYHNNYLAIYMKLGSYFKVDVLRTDQFGISECLNKIIDFTEKI